MDAVFFGIKRAFHGTLRVMRWPLHCYGLTSARFDMMWAIYKTPMRRARQSEVRRMLGVSAPTVSRMVKSLVHRRRDTTKRLRRLRSLRERAVH
jgi:DNA-binding MarR family transcriptional regulator